MRNPIFGLACVFLAFIVFFCFFAFRQPVETGADTSPMFAAVGSSEEETEPGDWDSEATSASGHCFGRKSQECDTSYVETIDLIQGLERAVNSADGQNDAEAARTTSSRWPDRTEQMPDCAETWSKAPSRMPYATEEDERDHGDAPPLPRR